MLCHVISCITSMGEQLREQRWDPVTDAIAQDILDMVAYAKTKNVQVRAGTVVCGTAEFEFVIRRFEFGESDMYRMYLFFCMEGK